MAVKHAQRRGKRLRLSSVVGEIVLSLLALFGVICAVVAGLAWTMDIGIILFKTGSMSPGIPAGSVAIVRTIPASEAQVGMVVTVERGDLLPITHRVISNEPAPDSPPGTRMIEMKGDANPGPDLQPYKVTEVRKLLWSHAGWGKYVVAVSKPWVMGVIVLIAAGIVTWAFWPRAKDEKVKQGDGDAPASTAGAGAGAPGGEHQDSAATR